MLLNENWKILASRLGEARMRHLLSLQVFMLSENKSYVQVSGVAVADALTTGISHTSRKRVSEYSGGNQDLNLELAMLEDVVKSLSSVLVFRHNIFYGGMKQTQSRNKHYSLRHNTHVNAEYVSNLIGLQYSAIPKFYDHIYFHSNLSKVFIMYI